MAALKPPAPVPAYASLDAFSAERALVHVRSIARVPHPIGSVADAQVRDYLIAQLSQLGASPTVFPSVGIDPTARMIIAGRTNDIVARFSGTSPGKAIMLMAHYDSVYRAPGAGDDASGTACILEIIRALKAGPPLQRDVVVLFTDGEEAGLLGAEAFASSHPWIKDIGLIMNFEARGNSGPSLLFETSTHNRPLVEAVSRVAPHPIGSSLFYELYKLLPNDTDFTVFRPAAVPGLNFAFGGGLEAYHSSLDTADNLSLASVQHDGSYGLSLTRYFGQLDLAAFRNSSEDNVFFDWFGSRLVTYNQRWIIPGQILITCLLALALVLVFRRRQVTAPRVILGVLACIGILLLVTAAATAESWILFRVLGGRRIISDCPANLFLLGGLMLLGCAITILLLQSVSKRLDMKELSLAALSLWYILSWLLALMLPSGSYLLFWPLLLAVIGNIAGNISPAGSSGQWIRSLPAVASAVLLFAPVIYLLYIFLTLQMVSVAASALLVAVFILISIPMLEPSMHVSKWLSFGTFLAASLIVTGTGITLSGHTPQHPRPDSVFYSLNSDENSAVWLSYDGAPDGWTRQFLGGNAQSRPVGDYLAGFARPLLAANAPVLPLAPPVIENVQHTKDGPVHNIRMKIRSQRNAEVLYLRFAEDVQPVSVKLAGRDVPLHKGGRFGLTLHAMGEQGADLELSVTAPAAVSFWLMDRTYGLPVEAHPRPADLMGMDSSDVTLVCRKYRL